MYGYDKREALKQSKELTSFEEHCGVLPKHKIVCPTCNGKGHHVNPSIDAGGLSQEDFDGDPDFYEDYMSGMYDVSCYECGGENVVEDVDYERAKHECPELLKEWEEWLQSAYDSEAEYAAERRMGA